MEKLKQALKAALIKLQQESKLPADLNELDIAVFDEPLLPIKNQLQTLYNCCEEALHDVWDRSDSGFISMRDSIIDILENEIEYYENEQD